MRNDRKSNANMKSCVNYLFGNLMPRAAYLLSKEVQFELVRYNFTYCEEVPDENHHKNVYRYR